MTYLDRCIICGHTELTYHFSGTDKNVTGRGRFRYSRCARCGVVFLNPRPEEAAFAVFYPNGRYFSLRKIDTTSASTRMRRFLYRLYFYAKNDRPFLREMLRPMNHFSRGTLVTPGARLLDIGCGSGQFLHEMKQFGVDARGVDPHHRNEENDTTIYTGNLADAGFEAGSFDLVTMNHVLEHIADPHQILDEVRRLLKDDGLFIIAVPNNGSLVARLFGKNWYQVDTPRHLVLYSSRILQTLLIQYDFEIVKIRYNSNPRQFTHSLANLFNLPWLRRFTILLDILLTPIVFLINYLYAGDQCEFFCRKKKGPAKLT